MAENQENSFDLSDTYTELYGRYTDEEIISILKKRDQYLAEAAKSAIGEAIKRGIIHSEQDLFRDEFRKPPDRFTFFPAPEKEPAREKLAKSINRTLVISGLIPLIEGVLRFRSGYPEKSIPVLIFAICWIGLSFMLSLKKKIIPIFLLVMNFTGLAYLIIRHYQKSHYMVMEWAIGLIVITLNFYLLLFYRKLGKSESQNQ